ncbi:MAG TPA: nitroreductase, partial [Beijerinckiaceae bacterium]|nr:nitroreductase [Beijerinckiaceae bacterium]
QGLGTCAQGYWARYPQTLKRILDHDDDHMVCSGMALGWPDRAAPINTLRTRRDPLEAWGEMKGF